MANPLVHFVSGKENQQDLLTEESVYYESFINIFCLQNLLFYYEHESSSKPSGVIFLEGCYCERLIAPQMCLGSPATKSSHKEEKLQVINHYI